MTGRTQEHGHGFVNPVRLIGWSAAAALLLVPLIAMQFTTEVAWGAEDFAVFAAMLIIAGGLMELAVRLSGKPAVRIFAGLIILAAFLLVWVELAVGIFS